MKYSIIGRLRTANDIAIVNLLNKVLLYKLDPRKGKDEQGRDILNFEVHVSALVDKDSLFADLKGQVNALGGEISWHECTHDEDEPLPCTIIETYKVE
jgi:hypothetical protein